MIFQLLINFILINQIIALSFNQPRFRPNTTWNSNAITFASQSIVGNDPFSIFINSENSIYTLNRQTGEIHIWQNESSINPSKTISGSLSDPSSIFVTTNGDIYVNNGYRNGHVDKWIAENETWVSVMSVESQCFGFFIDIYESLYCSMTHNHKVNKKWSNGTTIIVAGTGVEGSSLNRLTYPDGIFVDINLNLYVADGFNDRIQLFRLNQRNGITVAGKRSSKVTIELNWPTGIVLDSDQHLFIVDSNNDRLIGSDKNGFRCIFGCSGSSGSTNDKLSNPHTMSFDSYGNIYVTDYDNNRIQKIIKMTQCNISTKTTTTSTIISTSTTSIATSTRAVISSALFLSFLLFFSSIRTF